MKILNGVWILSLLIATPLGAQPNLLVNGGFDGSLAGWDAFPDQEQSTGYSPLDANNRPGSGSAEQTYLGPSQSLFSLASISQVFGVVPGGTYRFSGKIRSRPLVVTANFLPPKIGMFWFRADGNETTQSARAFASGVTSGDTWVAVSGTGVAPPDAAFGIFGLFNPAQQGFTALFDDIVVTGPAGGCSRAPRDVAVSFRGRVSGCGPRTSSCLAGEIIDFAPALPSYEISVCDRITWTFGDGSSSTEVKPTHVFTGAGPFPVVVKIENVFGSSEGSYTIDLSARVVVTSLPGALVQGSAGGATSTFTLRNIGGSASQITLGQSGTFFQQQPASFSLQPGEARSVTITGVAVPAGRYEGTSNVSGPGVPANAAIRVLLLSSPTPPGPVSAGSVQKRIDIQSSATATTINGTASFANRGSIPLQGLLVSDVPWLIPQSDPVNIAGGATSVVSFTIDRTQRTDDGELGAATGNLSLVFLNGSAPGKSGEGNAIEPDASPGTASAAVAVVHTVGVGTSPGSIPALAADEVALYVPGIAHAQGTGLFISDLTLTNLLQSGTLSNFKMYFRPAVSTSTTVSANFNLTANQPLRFGDIAQTVFNVTAGVGTVHLRGKDIGSVSAAASVFNTSNPGGTFGTSIPAFRSDRAVGSNEKIFLTGLKSDATNHTNLLLQETSGNPVTVGMTFFNEQGAPVGTRTEPLPGFGMVQIGAVAPIGSVSVEIGPSADSIGKIVAFASPVDRASGDSWAVVDWAKQYGYDPASQVLIPVVASARGANNTYFRTDAALMNTSTQQGSGTLRFYSRGGAVVDRQVNLPAGQSILYNDMVSVLFGIVGDDVGYVVFTPASGRFALTSRTYTTVTGQNATFGSGTPTLSMNGGIRLGQVIRFGGIDDAALETVQAGRAGTFRTNVGMVNPTDQAVTVRATLRYSSGGQRTATQAISSAQYSLAPRQFLQLNGISGTIIGAQRANLGDLSNMQLDLEVISGNGSIVAYSSSVDNGTGDSQLRVE